MKHKKWLMTAVSLVVVALIAGSLLAQRGPGRGPGRGFGRGKGGPGFRGARQDTEFAADHAVIHFLLSHGSQIRRQVKNLPTGVETLTQSDNPEIAAKIQEHVAAMYDRVEEVRPIHMRDPLFRELFRHANQIEMKAVETKKGVRVVETSKDPYVARLLQEHAKVVSLFIKNGHAEARKNHNVPGREARVDAGSGEQATLVAATCCDGESGCAAGCCRAESTQAAN